MMKRQTSKPKPKPSEKKAPPMMPSHKPKGGKK